MVEPNTLEQRIREGVPDVTHVAIEDLTGTKDHYRATVVSSAFADKSRVEQQRMIYRALGELMDGPVHALTLDIFTPESWERAQQE